MIYNIKREQKMKILFDARWINTTSPDGITRYSKEIIKELSRSKTDLTLLIHTKAQLADLPKLEYIVTNSPKHPSELGQARRLNRHDFDVVYSPHFLFGGKGREFKLIRTVLDLIPFQYKNKQSKLVWKLFHANMYFFKKLISDSDGLVTISETVRHQLHKYTKLKISVVHCAPTSLKTNRVNTTKELFYIGRYEPYKNVETLVRATKLLPDYKLILAGNCPQDRKHALSSLITNDDQVEFLGIISDAEYQDRLNSAFAMVSASKAEGFGLQLVEAMSVGCPVVCSDIEIFKEIVGDAGLYFGSSSADELARAVQKLEDRSYWKEISSKSKIRSKKYNWHTSTHKLNTFFAEVVGNS